MQEQKDTEDIYSPYILLLRIVNFSSPSTITQEHGKNGHFMKLFPKELSLDVDLWPLFSFIAKLGIWP
jgi:hypothetical protein